MCEIKVGDTYVCKPVGIQNEVIGTVEQTYTNTVLISVVNCQAADRPTVIELQNRLLVKKDQLLSYANTEIVAVS